MYLLFINFKTHMCYLMLKTGGKIGYLFLKLDIMTFLWIMWKIIICLVSDECFESTSVCFVYAFALFKRICNPLVLVSGFIIRQKFYVDIKRITNPDTKTQRIINPLGRSWDGGTTIGLCSALYLYMISLWELSPYCLPYT